MNEGVSRLLAGEGLTLGYGARIISEGLDMQIAPGSFTAILGPNACGKSTLLRALSGLGKAEAGQVIVNDRRLESYTPRQLAKHLDTLPQSATSPDLLTVYELVCRGRYAYQGFLSQFGSDDRQASKKRSSRRGLFSWLIGRSRSSPEANVNAHGLPWCSRNRPNCCCLTSHHLPGPRPSGGTAESAR